MLLIQGFEPDKINTEIIAPCQMGRPIGNAMTLPVLQGILQQLLPLIE